MGKKACAQAAQRCLAAAACMHVAGFSWGLPLLEVTIVTVHDMILACVSVAAMLVWEVQSELYCNVS